MFDWESLNRDPRAWLVQADRLKRAADLVGSRFQGEANALFKAAPIPDPIDDEGRELWIRAYELALPAYMLIGYAIECLAKGLLVTRDDSDQTVRWMTKKHLHSALLVKAGVELSDGERFLVDKRLYQSVTWSGRYPAPHPAQARELKQQILAAKGSPLADPRALSTDHYRESCDLFDRLESELKERIASARRTRLRPREARSRGR
jgi:hypothetical protein